MSDAAFPTALRDLFQYPLGERLARLLVLWFAGMLGYGLWAGSPYVVGIAVGGAVGVLLGRLTAMADEERRLPDDERTYEIDL